MADGARCEVIRRSLHAGESLTSWYTRIARANAYSSHELGSVLLGRAVHSVTVRDLDIAIDRALARALSATCQQDMVEIDLAALTTWEWQLSGTERRGKGPPRWVLDRRKRSDQQRYGFWTQACPSCLREDTDPYFRLAWRLAFLTECPLHQVRLIDRCPECQTNLDYVRWSQGGRRPDRLQALSVCTVCRLDWASIEAHPSSESLARWQSNLIEAFSTKWLEVGEHNVPIPLLLDGVFLLQRMLRSPVDGRRLLYVIGREVELEPARPPSDVHIEYLAVMERRALMHAIQHMMVDWPHRFLDATKRCGVRWSALGDQKGTVPYWLARVARLHLDRTWYQPSPTEAQSVARFLTSHGTTPTRIAVREWLGAWVSKPSLGTGANSLDAPVQLTLPAISLPRDGERLLQCLVRRLVTVLKTYCKPGCSREGPRPVQAPLI
jgi:hypothetical protein